MTKVERIMAAIRGGDVDKTPKGEFYIEDGLAAQLLQLTGNASTNELDFAAKLRACEILGLDALVFDANALSDKDNWQELRRWREETDLFLFAIVDGPFQGVSHRYPDFAEFLMDTVKDKERIESEAKDVIRTSAEKAGLALEAGAHGIMIGDDIAYHQGLYISPRQMRELFLPHLGELAGIINAPRTSSPQAKTPLFFHSDGNLLQILADITKLGFDGLHSLEPVMDIHKVREITGPDFCLMGGFAHDWFDAQGIEKARALIDKAASGGPYIFGSSAGILDGNLPAAEVLRVYRLVDEYSA